jgi:hypothetical protein
MPTFPRNQADISALADTMAAGITSQPAWFPHGDAAAIETAAADFRAAATELQDALAAVRNAAAKKLRAQQALTSRMRCQLALCQVDCTGEAERLSAIGWGPRREKRPAAGPGQVTDVTALVSGADNELVSLAWRKPIAGGKPSDYLVERRTATAEAWQIVATPYTEEATLKGQASMTPLEYRIIARNTAGEAAASAPVTIILPPPPARVSTSCPAREGQMPAFAAN